MLYIDESITFESQTLEEVEPENKKQKKRLTFNCDVKIFFLLITKYFQ